MNIIDLSRILIDKSFSAINAVSHARWLIDCRKYKRYIRKNVELKDMYRGERCYILGNGPSINQLDTSLIKDKATFVVNKFYKSSIYADIKPTFHCIYDRFIFEECKEDLNEIISKNEYNTRFLLTRRAIGQIEKDDNCYYVYSNLLPTYRNHHYDLTKNANTWLNVIPFVIMCAIYMGFSEIVLLGCDFSLFASRKDSHFYDSGASVDRQESLFQDLQGHAIVCCQHSYLKKYADANGIKIVNCTPGSLLDVYPQDDLINHI
ncbi:MAG: DUF115 domain-containing protein [Oscillospiraceae bacterium]|nr:DUF115 domain-containing protein [Oscillospiraceae bacterium]